MGLAYSMSCPADFISCQSIFLKTTSQKSLSPTFFYLDTRQSILNELNTSSRHKIEIEVPLSYSTEWTDDQKAQLFIVAKKSKNNATIQSVLRYQDRDWFETAIENMKFLKALARLKLLGPFHIPRFSVDYAKMEIRFPFIEGTLLDQLVKNNKAVLPAMIDKSSAAYLNGISELKIQLKNKNELYIELGNFDPEIDLLPSLDIEFSSGDSSNLPLRSHGFTGDVANITVSSSAVIVEDKTGRLYLFAK